MKKLYSKIEAALPSMIFILLFVVMLLNIAVRELTSQSLDWPIEFSRYSLVWLTFLGAVYLYSIDKHIKVDSFWFYLSKKLNPNIVRCVEILKLSIISFFGIFLSYYGYVFSEKLKFFSSPSLNISQSYLYIVVPISGVLIALISIMKIYKLLRKKD
ncbi:TRAP transporter small permease [Photobacterium sp. GJ3]|uniref:TRAP transporter small permease n=1 Tax=Photobacterium sp. GJ3 TaxID=2829502 RepID=UPI001B8B0420|nr:TRAP transporter small permease [Photobacterium sp. GJ3]QUJ67975.1 TRAP transporter small permease [Photobacterium sp. GJ3]